MDKKVEAIEKHKKTKAIEKDSSSENQERNQKSEGGNPKVSACCGLVKQKSLKIKTNNKLQPNKSSYSPSSYTKNFDKGNDDDESYGNFASRYAPPSSPTFNDDS
ncbi:hypothetical protein Adt_21520 [Abeliophyllum distichum]|uniref:Uncharacterized protein n=1 Tax=Abeliophyllum distichum TaxID=126358 RepID=A0ABD1SZJ9_9LAMI